MTLNPVEQQGVIDAVRSNEYSAAVAIVQQSHGCTFETAIDAVEAAIDGTSLSAEYHAAQQWQYMMA